jgi:hypothetical protein
MSSKPTEMLGKIPVHQCVAWLFPSVRGKFLVGPKGIAMRVERLTGTTNVVRFPVERRARPTMAVLLAVLPDIRQTLSLADAYGLALPVSDLDDQVDAATAEHIANQLPKDGPEGAAMLTGLLDPVIARGGGVPCGERCLAGGGNGCGGVAVGRDRWAFRHSVAGSPGGCVDGAGGAAARDGV